jgi:two-component system nitrate/nitrite response regulator NarL
MRHDLQAALTPRDRDRTAAVDTIAARRCRPPVRVAVVSDRRLYREGLAGTLAGSGELDLVAALPAPETLPALAERVDVALLDAGAAQAPLQIDQLRALMPDLRVVLLSPPLDETTAVACAEAGVAGYVSEEDSLQEVTAAIVCAARGEVRCPPRVAAALARRIVEVSERASAVSRAGLTRREAEILGMIADGLSNKQIAAALTVELTTVKNHVHRLLEKLGVSSRSAAAAMLRVPPSRRQVGLPDSGPRALAGNASAWR